MILFNSVIILLCCWLLMYANLNIRIKNKYDVFRFRLFAVRDALAIHAMKGEIDEKSQEYLLFCKVINSALRTVEKQDFISFVRFINRIRMNPELQEELAKDQSCFKNGKSKILDELLKDFYIIMLDILNYNTGILVKMLIWFVYLTSMAKGKIGGFVKNYSSSRDFLKEQTA